MSQGVSKHGQELGLMNAALIKELQANRDKRRAAKESTKPINPKEGNN